jgi:hypothetical protein
MSHQSSQADPASLLRMNQLVMGFTASQAIAVAAKLRIADLITQTLQVEVYVYAASRHFTSRRACC